MLRFAFISSLAMILLTAMGCVGAYLVWQSYGAPGPLTEARTIVIPRGEGVDEIAETLETAGVIASRRVFQIVTRVEGAASRLRPGEYAFEAGMSARRVAEIIASGQMVTRRLTIPEGLTTFQILNLIRNAEGLEGAIVSTPEEGELLPDTYHYNWGYGREQMVQRLRRAMADAVQQQWERRFGNLPYRGPRDAVIVASIVERETALPAERARVAAVYVNRLRRGMKLDADPTVIYGITQGRENLGRALSLADLRNSTPWNTYVVNGLPPTPIGNPGRASIAAALRPASTDEIFFVADGSGGHAFARNAAEHAVNVARYRAIQAQQRATQQRPGQPAAPAAPQPLTPPARN
jgi:UPF0755 protein